MEREKMMKSKKQKISKLQIKVERKNMMQLKNTIKIEGR
jgi:hypothetical protein